MKKKTGWMVVLVVLLVGAFGLWYFGGNGDNDTKLPQTSGSQSAGEKTEKTEASVEDVQAESVQISDDILEYRYTADDVAEEENVEYVNNLIKLSSANELSDTELVEAIKPVLDTEVVGNIINTDFIVKSEDSYTLAEIEEYCTKLQELPEIALAIPVYHSNWATDFTPDGPEWNQPKDPEAEWSDVAGSSGRNWGVEAINAPTLWDYQDEMDYVNVGVLDGGFYDQHEDLHFKEIFDTNEPNNFHGTHVAGTIGAMFNNGVGIDGVAPKANLYGASISWIDADWDQRKQYVAYAYLKDLHWLINEKDCKVVNMSCGKDPEDIAEASSTDGRKRKEIVDESNQIARMLDNSIKKGKDFVIVKAAGNANQELDAGVNANWDVVSAIGNTMEYSNVYNRIIVVGNVGKNPDGFVMAEKSNHGDRVDIVAPGEQIYSMTEDGYGFMSGTSMAAPHVSGTAASLFGLDPALTGPEVKQILIDTASVSCKYQDDKFNVKDYKLLDAGAAAQEVLGINDMSHLDKFRGRWSRVAEEGTPQEGLDILDLTNIEESIKSEAVASTAHVGPNGNGTTDIKIVDENHFQFSANHSDPIDVRMNPDGTISFWNNPYKYENQATKNQTKWDALDYFIRIVQPELGFDFNDFEFSFNEVKGLPADVNAIEFNTGQAWSCIVKIGNDEIIYELKDRVGDGYKTTMIYSYTPSTGALRKVE